MKIFTRFKKLNIWNKIGAIGAICSISGSLVWLIWPTSPNGTILEMSARGDAVVQAPVNSPDAVVQNMASSPGSTQIAITGNVTVNTDRRLRGAISETLLKRLRRFPCPITVGALGVGGEPDALAGDFLRIAKAANCPVQGVFHGVGFTPFDGIQIKYSPRRTPTSTVSALIKTLREAKFVFVSGPDPSKEDGSVYIYVGNRP